MKFYKATIYAFILGLSGFLNSCATGDYDQIEEQMSQETEQEIQQEEIVEDDSQGQTQVSSDEAVAETEEIQEVMQEPVTENSSESLASELDKLSTPDAGSIPDETIEDTENSASNDMAETVTEAEPADTYVGNDSDMGMGGVASPEPKARSTVKGPQSNYVVQPGDTLGHIAFLVYGSFSRWSELAEDNNITDPGRIFPGDVLKFRVTERSKTFTETATAVEQEVIMVQKGDTLEVIAERLFGRRDFWKPMWFLNKDEIPNPDAIKEGQILKYIDPKKMAQALDAKGLSGITH